MEVTIDNLEEAVCQFYHTDSVLQAQAHQWLTAAQSSVDAWAFVWQLLQPNRTAEVQFFAATTLQNKIMRDWKEVPEDQYGSLKEKLLEHVIQYSTGPKIVLNRLCIALSAYIIQTTPYFWQNSLTDMMELLTPSRFPNIPPERIIWILLEIYSVIPEEFDTMTLSQKHKSLIRNDLVKVYNHVISMVDGVLGCGAGQEIENQAVKTAVSWLRFGVPLPSVLPLAKKLVNYLQTNLSQDPTESYETELEALYQMSVHPDTHQYPNTVLNLLEILLPLANLTQTHSDNPELVMNVYRVLVGLAESHTMTLLKTLSKQDSNKILIEELIRVILRCTAGPGQYPIQETHSQLTLTFWYILQDDLNNITEGDVDLVKRIIIPAYKEVTSILLVKSQYPNQPMSSQDSETFRCYRQDIADTMVYCYYIVGEYLLDLLVSKIQTASSWQQVESVYHICLALAESINSDSEDCKVMQLLSLQPPQEIHHPVLLNTLNQAIGGYSDWLSCHSDALGTLIPRLVKSLENQETATSATMALKDITRECTVSLKPYVEPLYVSCQEALLKGSLKHNECTRLMYSMGKLLSLMTYDTMLVNINNLLSTHINSIELILTSEEGEKQNRKVGLLGRLRMLSQLLLTLYCDDTSVQPPSYIALTRLIPVFSSITQSQYNTSQHIVEEICIVLKNGVSSLLEQCEPLLTSISNIIYTCYSLHPNNAALDLVRNVVILFGCNKESESCRLSLMLLHSIVDKTLNLSPLDEHMEPLQCFFIMLANIVKKQTSLFAQTIDTNRLFTFGIGCLMLSDQRLVKACGAFICCFITLGRETQLLHQTVHNNGQLLVTTCLTCIGTDVGQRWAVEVLCEILLCLNKKFSDDLTRWLSAALSQNDFPSPRASHQIKSQFQSNVLKERTNRRKLQETVTEFSLICRGLVTTDFNFKPPSP